MSFLHTIRRCKVEYDHISVRHSYTAYTVCGLHMLGGSVGIGTLLSIFGAGFVMHIF